jgi:hypothetical protein
MCFQSQKMFKPINFPTNKSFTAPSFIPKTFRHLRQRFQDIGDFKWQILLKSQTQRQSQQMRGTKKDLSGSVQSQLQDSCLRHTHTKLPISQYMGVKKKVFNLIYRYIRILYIFTYTKN